MTQSVAVFTGAALADYHFGADHPFGPQRHDAFWGELQKRGLDQRVELRPPELAGAEQIACFHTAEYVARVQQQSKTGQGFLDYGDTPARRGIYEAAAHVVGSSLAALDWVMGGAARHAFVPIAGLHHARRERAGGFCVFNDCGVLIEQARARYDLRRIAYVDIDAHHGDGVFYSYEDDPEVIFADLHEDGQYLYPGTGAATETGSGAARGTKLNIPMPPGADDAAFRAQWPRVEALLEQYPPELILLQCGADSLAGDPLTHLRYSAASHAYATERLGLLAQAHAGGRLLALGGGGYNLANIGQAWCAVVEALLSP